MKTHKIILSFLLISFLAINAQTKWSFDKNHTAVRFEVTHLVISTVPGYFKEFDGTVVTKGDSFENADVNFVIKTASIFTDNKKRDKHLKSSDFFNAAKYPEIKFVSKSFTKVGENKYKMVGDLTMKDVTKEVSLDVTFNGMVKDPWGNTRAGFKVTGKLNRFDYGLKWNALLETGGAVVGKEVDLIINVELMKK